jgi:hypothetical protein
MTPQEYDKEINILSQQLSIAKTQEERTRIQLKINKKRLQKEIAEIRIKIQQIS